MKKPVKPHILIISEFKYRAQNKMKMMARGTGDKVVKQNFHMIITKKAKYTSRSTAESYRECNEVCKIYVDEDAFKNEEEFKEFMEEHNIREQEGFGDLEIEFFKYEKPPKKVKYKNCVKEEKE